MGGVVKNIAGVEKAKEMKGVADLELEIKLGDILPSLKHSTQRFGFAVILAETRRKAEKIMERVSDLVKVEIG